MKHKQTISFGIGALALAGMALPASAADLGVRPASVAPLPIAYNWTSCYIGANGGGKWADFSNDGAVLVGGVPVFPFTVANDNSSSGGVGGGQVGCQWQSGAFVFGIEGDFDGTSLRRTFVADGGAIFPFFAGDTLDFKNDWQASIRGRLGYAWDRWMVYATGGVAFANVKATLGLVPFAFGPPTAFASVSDTITGGTVGAGVEYAILNNLSLAVEYRFTTFGNQNFALGTVGGILPAAVVANPRLDTNEVTARLNWHFNWWGGGPGRY